MNRRRKQYIAQLAQKYDIHPVMIDYWKKQLTEHSAKAFSRSRHDYAA